MQFLSYKILYNKFKIKNHLVAVAVLGASGKVGTGVSHALVNQESISYNGQWYKNIGDFKVNAIVRNPNKFSIVSDYADCYRGDANNQSSLEQPFSNVEAVVVSVSSEAQLGEPSDTFKKVAEVVSAVMKEKGVKRVIQIGGAGMLDGQDGKLLCESPEFPKQFYNLSLDHNNAFQVYKNAGLDVTAIACPQIKDLPFTGKYEVGVNQLTQNNKWYVGNRDVGDLVVKILQGNLYVGDRVYITSAD